MNTFHGWIKLYRCLMDDAVCQKSVYFHLWVTLLLMAAHKEHEFIFNNQIQKLQPGQLLTGRKKLSKLTGIVLCRLTGTGQNPGYRCGVHVGSMRGDFDVCLGEPLGDLDHNCLIDLLDYSVFSQTWMATDIDINWNADADFVPSGSSEGVIDLGDISVFTQNWLFSNITP